MKPAPEKLMLQPINVGVHQVLTEGGEHVGNLKWIGGHWKFKAIGYASNGEVIPGGGPFTDSHNATFATLDTELINTRLHTA